MKTPYEIPYDQKRPWKTFFALFQGDRSKLAASLAVYLVKHAPVWVLPLYIGFVVDQISKPSFAWDQIVGPSVGMLVLIVQNVVTHTAFARLLSQSLRNMETRLRQAQVRRLQELSLHFLSHRSAGTLQNKILRDVENLNTLTNNLANGVFPSLITIAIAIALTLTKTPVLTAFFVLLAPLAIVLQRLFTKRLERDNQEFRKKLEAMNARVLEMIEMIPVTRAHALEEIEIGKMDEHLANVRERGKRLDLTVAWFGASAWVVFMSAQVLSLIVMIFLAVEKVISIGDVIVFQTYFTALIASLNGLLNLLPDLARGRDSIRSMGDILESPDLEMNRGKPTMSNLNGQFEAREVSFSYPGQNSQSLRHVNFRVEAGETIAVVGESGSGKSTLMQLLIGFYRPSEGTMLVDGIDMAGLDLRSYRSFLATVSQQTLLFQASVRDNIAYGLTSATDDQLWSALTLAHAREFVERLPHGLETDLGVHGGSLSGGQKQRLAIARALLRNPRVIILDEATSALDVQSELEVQKAVEAVSRGRTTFIVAHRMSTIRGADRIFVMKAGQLVETGTRQELLDRKGEFYRLVQLGEHGAFVED